MLRHEATLKRTLVAIIVKLLRGQKMPSRNDDSSYAYKLLKFLILIFIKSIITRNERIIAYVSSKGILQVFPYFPFVLPRPYAL